MPFLWAGCQAQLSQLFCFRVSTSGCWLGRGLCWGLAWGQSLRDPVIRGGARAPFLGFPNRCLPSPCQQGVIFSASSALSEGGALCRQTRRFRLVNVTASLPKAFSAAGESQGHAGPHPLGVCPRRSVRGLNLDPHPALLQLAQLLRGPLPVSGSARVLKSTCKNSSCLRKAQRSRAIK